MIAESEKESRRLMMDAAVAIVAQYGFEGFTTKRWASKAGVAEGSLYYHFKGKHDLLEQTFYYIDQEITEHFGRILKIIEGAGKQQDIRREVVIRWKECFSYLVENSDKTLYYYRFCSSPRYNGQIQQTQIKILEKTLDEPGGMAGGQPVLLRQQEKKRGRVILWTYLIDTTAAFAFRIITHGGDADEATQNEMVRLFLEGVLPVPRTESLSVL